MDQHDDPTAARHGGPPDDAAPSQEGPRDGTTEQVEEYLRLEEHIQQLQADRRPHPPEHLSPEDARAYQMAALFRAAAPGAAEPDPAFVARLRSELEREMHGHPSPPLRVVPPAPAASEGERTPTGVSRRGLLAGGLAAAAAAAGVVAGIGLDRASVPAAQEHWSTPLVKNGTWLAVAAVDAVPVGGVRRFATDQVVGFLRRTSAGYFALSGACTHMGCLLSWNGTARTFDCPCHGGRFLETGAAAPSSPVAYLPLPSMQTRVQGGQVWVYVPAPVAMNAPSADSSTDPSGANDPYSPDAAKTPGQ